MKEVRDKLDLLERWEELYKKLGRGEEEEAVSRQKKELQGIQQAKAMEEKRPAWSYSPQPEEATLPKPRQLQVEAKVGRSEPCPCGSGKKYKKCCGANK